MDQDVSVRASLARALTRILSNDAARHDATRRDESKRETRERASAGGLLPTVCIPSKPDRELPRQSFLSLSLSLSRSQNEERRKIRERRTTANYREESTATMFSLSVKLRHAVSLLTGDFVTEIFLLSIRLVAVVDDTRWIERKKDAESSRSEEDRE